MCKVIKQRAASLLHHLCNCIQLCSHPDLLYTTSCQPLGQQMHSFAIGAEQANNMQCTYLEVRYNGLAHSHPQKCPLPFTSHPAYGSNDTIHFGTMPKEMGSSVHILAYYTVVVAHMQLNRKTIYLISRFYKQQ